MAQNWHCVNNCQDATSCTRRIADGSCPYEYDAAKTEPRLRWPGPGDPPRQWRLASGGIVYRTYADYCD